MYARVCVIVISIIIKRVKEGERLSDDRPTVQSENIVTNYAGKIDDMENRTIPHNDEVSVENINALCKRSIHTACIVIADFPLEKLQPKRHLYCLGAFAHNKLATLRGCPSDCECAASSVKSLSGM